MKSAQNCAIFPTVAFICTLPRYTHSKIFGPRRIYTQKLWPKTYFSWTARTAHIHALFTKLSMQSWSTRWVDQNMSRRHKLEMVGTNWRWFVLMWLCPVLMLSSCLTYWAFPLQQNHKNCAKSAQIWAYLRVLHSLECRQTWAQSSIGIIYCSLYNYVRSDKCFKLWYFKAPSSGICRN